MNQFNTSHQARERRRRVIPRLEAQLKSGKKQKPGLGILDLSPWDINRIQTEITVLNKRI